MPKMGYQILNMFKKMLTVDLSNATKYPDIDEFFGFTTESLIYMYIASTVPNIIAIVGNIIVLYTSLRYKSFNLCKITVTLLEHLAAADLLHVILGLLPKDLVIFTKTCIFGKVLCAINGYFILTFGTAGIYILVIISIYRLTLLRNPLWLSAQQKWKQQFFMVGLWLVVSIQTLYVIFSNSTVYYDPFQYSCVSSSFSEDMIFILALIFLGVPMMLIVIYNIIIAVQYQRKMSQERGMRHYNINA